MDMTYIYVAIGIAFVINIAGGRAILFIQYLNKVFFQI